MGLTYAHGTGGYIEKPTKADIAYDNTSTSAGGKVDSVNSALQALGNTGSDALKSAVAAIEDLGKFKPSAVTVVYTPPTFENSVTAVEPNFSTTDSLGDSTISPTELTFTYNVPDIKAPSDQGATAPTIPDFPGLQALAAPDSGTEPTAPSVDTLSEISAPAEVTTSSSFVLRLPPDPDLMELEYPDLPPFAPPDTTIPDMIAEKPRQVLPLITPYETAFVESAFAYGIAHSRKGTEYDELPFKISGEEFLMNSYAEWLELSSSDKAATKFSDGGDQIYKLGIGALLQSFAGTPSDTVQGCVRYGEECNRLGRLGELRRLKLDTYYLEGESYRTWVKQVYDAHIQDTKVNLQLFEIMYASRRTDIETHLQVVQSVVALYNAQVAELKSNIDLYRHNLRTKLFDLDRWKAKLSTEAVKTKGNALKGQVYAAQVNALAAQVSVYNAQVEAAYTSIDLFKSQMDAALTKADVAKSSLSIYAAQVDAYVASLSAYKAQYEQYNASVRATSAKNALTASKTKLSAVGMASAGAQATLAIAKTELDVEKLKAQIINASSGNEKLKLFNLIEQMRAQVDTQKGRAAISKWAAETNAKSIPYDAYALNVQAAARFYETASNAAYRASEQSLKAVLAATEAAAIAQESAARSGASVAQGAYSATHYSMSLNASGRESAEKSASVRESSTVGHTYQLTDELVSGLATSI